MSKMRSMMLNPDTEIVRTVLERLKENDGYCPCQVERSDDTKCPCRMVRERGECVCCLYVRREANNNQ